MIKNYIFDFGNVLARFYPEELTAPYVTEVEKAAAVSAVAFDRLYWDPLDAGTVTDDEVKDKIIARLPKEEGERACLAYDNWVRNLTPVEGMQEVVSALHKKGVKLYLLSNISQKFAAEYKEVKWIKELFDLFDGLVFSSDINIVKPSKEIFDYLLKKHGLKADDCLFIDDNANNIAGAKAVGIKGCLFDGNAQKLHKYLEI